jgi:hypothetical protein
VAFSADQQRTGRPALVGLNDLNGAQRLNGLNGYFPTSEGPTVRNPLIENRGVTLGSQIPRGLKQGIKKKFSQERLCLLTCLLMGDPAWSPTNGYPIATPSPIDVRCELLYS